MKASVSFLLAAAVLVLPALAQAKEVTVSIVGLKYKPAVVEVSVGDTVVWVNDDDRGHTAVAADGSFDSGEIRSGGRFEHKFSKAGDFPYGCDNHPRMRGKVVVKAK